MTRTLQFVCVLLIGAGFASAEQAAKGARKNAATPALRPGVPKGVTTKVPPLRNPGSDAARLYRANPRDRERVLERLPAARQARMRNELEWFDGLSKDEQQIVLKRSEALAALPPERQRALKEQMQALNRLEPERRRAVSQALRRLQNLSDDERSALLNRDNFRSRFSPEELQIINDLAAVMAPRM